MINTDRVIQLENYGDSHDDRKFLERVKKISMLASNSFHSLIFFNHWNIPSYHWHGISKGKFPCNNCGGEHHSPYCLNPREEVKIKKAKEERTYRRGGGGRNDGHSGGRGGGRGGRCQGDHKKWKKDKRDGE